ncbi:homoserine dehydrogenase [Taibaiella sp. KBW10]|uniref:homoserine dehydrogenase n=1 Tax=Taibaiella sp. KBW10 TaxID=2153357 RepID=UPI001F46016B|nr:homoserine dehydrogenase [Taibaiella sp. KBW10]
MSNPKLTIGLFGFGVVGEGIYKVLQDTKSLNATVKKICIKHIDKVRNAPAELFTTEADELLADEEINVIVELIDDAEAAYHIVTKALKQKKSVVSANKKLLANHLEELVALRDEHGVSLLYEAAVCGSVPIIRNLEEYYDNDLLSSVSGIINGSTNYILTKMKEEQLSYELALQQAQELGFAESDPTLDVEGIDAVNKLTIILKHAYGINEIPEDILYNGITHINERDIQFANEKGYQIKLVAQSVQVDQGKVAAFVLPTFVAKDSQLYNVRNEFNGVLIGSKLADEQFLYGKGAGRYPTSSAVLSDIAALRYEYRYEYKKSELGIANVLTNEIFLKVYVSFESWDTIDKEEFAEIEQVFKSNTRNYIVGIINLDVLHNAEWFYDKSISVIAIGEEVLYNPELVWDQSASVLEKL